MYKRILVPLDCSPVDDLIVDHLLGLCSYIQPKIFLLRVTHSHTRDALNYLEKEVDDCMEKIKVRFTAAIEVETIIEYGEPELIIPRVAKEKECDLIAFGTHGHKRIMDFLLGSVVDKVRHETSIPLLLIRAPQLPDKPDK